MERGRDRGPMAVTCRTSRATHCPHPPANRALRYSRLSREILLIEIPAGQAASHSSVTVQPPKPSLSIWAIIDVTRSRRSGLPWGKRARCDTLALTKSMAEAFLHAATHAPQPIQAAAFIARSESSCGTRIALASGGVPRVDRNVTPGLDDAVKGRAVDHQIADDGERPRPPRLDHDRVAVVETAACGAGRSSSRRRDRGPAR